MDDFELISAYTRKDALDDGELVDISEMGREAGIRFPVAVTRAVWTSCVKLSPAAERAPNDEPGRLWDLVWMLSLACRGPRGNSSVVEYELSCVTKSESPSLVRLKAHIGPGDDGAPVITVMFPEED